MSNAGKKVSAHYRGTLDDGTQFDSSYDRGTPLDFTCMAGQMIPGFDAAVVDMAVGEKKTVRIEAKDAYGEYDPAAIQRVPTRMIQGLGDMPDGSVVQLMSPMGPKTGKIEGDVVVIDMNHELAGKALTFEIELVSVAD